MLFAVIPFDSMARFLCNQGAGSSALVSPGGWEGTDGLVVAGQTVNTGLDENEAELGVLVLAVALEMLADGDSLLDKHVQVFWNLWCKTIAAENAEDLVPCDDLNLRNSVGIPQDNTNLRWGGTFAG